MLLITLLAVVLFAVEAVFRVDVSPRPVLLRVGSDQQLVCQVSDCSGSAAFSWTSLQDVPIYGQFRADNTYSKLLLHNVSKHHENTVQCAVRCSNGIKQATTTIRVYSFTKHPVISGHDRLVQGEQNTLTCEVSDVYPAEYMTLTWLRGDNVLHSEDEEFGKDVVRSSYTFTPDSEDDGKQITCRASLGLDHLPPSDSSRQSSVAMAVFSAPQRVRVSAPCGAALVGSDLSLTCDTSGKPAPAFSWSLIRPGGASVHVGNGSELVLRNVSLSDAGLYRCEVSNALGNKSATVTVDVHGPPVNTRISASANTLKEGAIVSVRCESDAAVSPRVRLLLTRESDGTETELQSDVGSQLLWFSNSSSVRDSGLYVCKAVNSYGSQRADAQLAVEPHPLEVSLRPGAAAVVLQLGSALSLSCEASGCPHPHFSWPHLDVQPDDTWLDSLTAASAFGPRPVQLRDQKNFTCVVRCGSVVTSRQVQVQVFSFPSDPVIETSGPLLEGEVTVLTCTAHRVFPAERFRVRWLDGETELSSQTGFASDGLTSVTSTLRYRADRRQRNVNLTCSVSLDMEGVLAELAERTASTTLELHHPPRGTSVAVTPHQRPREAESVSISCRTDSAPQGRLVLSRVLDGEEVELASSETSLTSFTIASAALSHSGAYVCQAQNQYGQQTASAQVTVQAPPRNTTVTILPSTLVQEGQNVTVCCHSVSFPPPAIYLRKLDNGSEVYSADGTFLLLNLTADDSGLYQVNVTNELGHETEVFTIYVMERHFSPPHSYNEFVTSALCVGLLASALAVLEILRRMKRRGYYELTKCGSGTV